MKSAKKALRKALKFTALSAVACASMVVASTTTAHAKQCIWNKGGYVLNASWYRSENVMYTRSANGDYSLILVGDPVQEDQWPVAQGRCTRGSLANEKLTVVLRVVGGKVGSDVVRIGASVTAAAAGVISVGVATAACPVTGVTCVLAGVAGGGAGKLAGLAATHIPDGKEIFYVGEPSTTNYLDTWGTIWSPQFGPGGGI